MVVKPTYEELVQKIKGLEKEALRHKKVEEALWQKTHDLGERVKELSCLYGIANLVEKQDISLEEILQGTVDLIPLSWQYPKITCARIIIQDREWKTKNFRETIWRQASDIKVHGELSGNLEVYYLEENPVIDEGPFLREEGNLINAIAGLTGRIVERKQGEEVLHRRSTIIEAISFATGQFPREIYVEAGILKILKRLGHATGVSRIYVFENLIDNNGALLTIQRYEWVAPGIEPQIDNPVLQGLPWKEAGFARWEKTLKQGESIYGRIREFPKSEQELLASQGILSIVVAPIFVEEKWWGFVGFDDCLTEREWPSVEIDALGTAANILGATIHHKRADEKLRKSEQKYRNIFENIQDVYYEVTLGGIILEISPSVEDISIYKREEIIGKSLYGIYVDPKKRDEFVKELLKNGNVVDYEILLQDKDCSQSYCSITAKLVYDKHGKPVKIIGSMHNISERKQMEQAFSQSETQKRAILDASVDRLRYVDKDMKIIWANKTTSMELDISSEDLVGQTCYKLFIGRDTPCKGCATVKARKTGKSERSVIHHPRVKGIEGESYWDSLCVPLKNDAGEIESFIQIARNITDQKQAMTALQESKDTLQAILAASPIGIGLVHNRIFDWVNKAMCNMLGYEEGSLLGETARILYPDEKEYDRAGRELYPRLEKNGIGQAETRWVKKSGDVVHCYLQTSPLNRSDPDKGVIVAVVDISERKQAESLVRNLSQKLIQAQERERQMISYELHDRIAQNLSILKIGYDTLFDGQSAISSELKEKMAKLYKIIKQTITAVRDLAYDLRPPGLDEMGLVKALEIYCEDFFENSGVAVDFQPAGIHKLNLDIDTEIHLYRLIQEGLNNIRKHADADQATIKLVGASPNIILRIEDDGKGFDVKARELALDNDKRMGLRSMQERVNLLQGKMTIQSRPIKGTKIFIKFPVKE